MNIRFVTKKDLDDIIRINSLSGLQSVSKEYLQHLIFDSAYKTIYLVIEDMEQIIGYIGICLASADAELCDIAVISEYRNRGYATQLLNSAIQECKKENIENIFLEVRESNYAARGLYSKFGFLESGIRKDYYKNPKENAIIMTKNMENNDESNS